MKTTNEEVTLAQFAAIGGRTEQEYTSHMFDMLLEGKLAFLLKVEAQVDLLEWLANGRLLNGDDFLVVFRTSVNRKDDSALHCVCSCVSDDFPKIKVRHALPGVMGRMPPEADGLEGFEVNFCDMEPTI